MKNNILKKIINIINKHSKLTTFFCGWLSVVALPPLYCFPLLFITISTLLWLINKSSNIKQAFSRGYYFGFSFFAFGFSWIGNAVLIDSTPLVILYPIILLACGIFFGLFIAIPTALSFLFRTPYAQYLAFASLIVMFEWIRSFLFTGFPWNLWGYTLAFYQPLLQLASFGGTYLLSLIVILICGIPFLWINQNKKKKIMLITLSSIMIILCFGWQRLSHEQNELSETIIRIVQPSIPQTLKWNEAVLEQNFEEYINLSTKKSLEGISAVLWGETASPFSLDYDEAHNYKARKAIPPKGYLITGQVRYHFSDNNRHISNSLLIYNKKGENVAHYDKTHLVPFGEYIPFRTYLPNWLRPLANTIGTFTPGQGPKTINLLGLPDLGSAICYEAIFPHHIINHHNRPQWVINPTNDGWYGNSFGPHQHFISTKLRAIEDGITIARVANNGISAVISPYGTVLKKLNLNQRGFIDVNLPDQLSFPTIYSLLGNKIIIFICLCILIIAFIFKRK